MSPGRRLLAYVDRYRRTFVLGLLCVVVTTALQLGNPWIIKYAVDDLNAGVTVQKAKLTRADLAQSTQESARFDIPISATEAGKKTINAEARFVLCQEQACKPVKETLALAVDITPAPAVAANPPKGTKKPPTWAASSSP